MIKSTLLFLFLLYRNLSIILTFLNSIKKFLLYHKNKPIHFLFRLCHLKRAPYKYKYITYSI